ncbi:MAG TPA: TolC family protein [Cytophagales bacterium]|jgi:outer membrane protein|nr:TolC family protein [Cytophagales bacterium]
MKNCIFFVFLFVNINLYSQSNNSIELDLAQCLEIALENNLQLKRSEINKKIQKIGYDQSILSQIPSLNIFSNYGTNWGRSIDPTTNQFIGSEYSSSGIGLSSGVTLFSGFSVRNTIKQSKVLLEKSVFDLDNTRNNVMLSVVSSYLSVLLTMDRLENAKFQLLSTQEQLSRINKLVEAGSLPITNRLNFEAQLAGDELSLIQQENAYRLSILQLKQIMLLETDKEIIISKPLVEVSPSIVIQSNTNDIYNRAIDILPELKSAIKNVESSKYDLRIARSGRFPTVNVSSNFNTNYSSYANRPRKFYEGTTMQEMTVGYLTSNHEETVSVLRPVLNEIGEDNDFTLGEQWKDYLSKSLSFSISFPIFNRYQTSSNIKRSKLNKQLADINVLEAKNQIRQTIETSFNDAIAASKSYSASLKQVQALEESFRIIKSQYNLGAINFTEYQVSNNNLVKAKNDLLSSKYDYIFKLKVLDFYQGKTLTF